MSEVDAMREKNRSENNFKLEFGTHGRVHYVVVKREWLLPLCGTNNNSNEPCTEVSTTSKPVKELLNRWIPPPLRNTKVLKDKINVQADGGLNLTQRPWACFPYSTRPLTFILARYKLRSAVSQSGHCVPHFVRSVHKTVFPGSNSNMPYTFG